MGKISICDLPLAVTVGVYPAEREMRQKIQMNVEFELDLSGAAASDNLYDTVNYAEIEERIVQLAENSSYQLLEALAGAVCRLVLEYAMVSSVTVRIEKPLAAKRARAIVVEHTEKRV
ncbi:MAG: dihydroneopterin aldolase [Lentisphaeria bacterium]|nr:dihydroneopterin aldolase [Lentisphaeria bacterium]